MRHSTDIFGNHVSYSDSGTSYLHTTDLFGNRVTYGSDGSEYLHTTDMFGNNVTYKSGGFSSAESDPLDGLKSFGGGLLVVAIVAQAIWHVVSNAYWLFIPVGTLLLLSFLWARVFGESKLRVAILFTAFVFTLNNIQEAYPYYTDKPMGLFAYLGIGIAALIVLLRWMLEEGEDWYSVLVFVACLVMFFYLILYHENGVGIVVIASIAIVGLPALIMDIVGFIPGEKANSSVASARGSFILSTLLMMGSAIITFLFAGIFLQISDPTVAAVFMGIFMLCVPIIINRIGNKLGLRMACSPFGHLFGVILFTLIVPINYLTQAFDLVVYNFGTALISSSDVSLSLLLYLTASFLLSVPVYSIINKLLTKKLKM